MNLDYQSLLIIVVHNWLEIMVGIRFVQGGYTYSNDVENKKLHWHSAQVNTALPLI